MRRVLFIGDANSFLIIQLVKWIEKITGLKIEIIHTLNTPVHHPENYSRVYSFRLPVFLFRLPFVGRWCRTASINLQLKKIQGKFCCAHIHAAKRVYTGILKELRKKTGKVILTMWGSDFNLVTETVKKQLQPLLQQADIITFATVKQKDLVLDYYPGIDQNKVRIVKFGLNSLEIMKNMDIDPEEIKQYFSIPENRTVITIGYNASPNQQHFRILRSLTDNKKLTEKRDEIILLFPLTYGGSKLYVQKLLHALSDSPFHYITVKAFLPDKEIAWLRMASDIMIQLQQRDQFSGSMQEYLYAGNVVITGRWLHYEELKNAGVYFREVNDTVDTGDEILKVLEDLPVEKTKCLINKEKIYSISSWTKNIHNWLKLYGVVENRS